MSRTLLDLVDADHRVTQVAGRDLLPDPCGIGEDRREQSVVEQG